MIGTSDRTFDTEQIRCIADNGRGDPDGVPATGWEHVSVSIVDRNDDFRLPAWTEMQRIKEVFWAPDETVLQYHPAESEYINVHGSVLHLWRPIDEALPTPPASAVGPAALGERPGTEPKR